jgi:tetratricopeptide (TPR) repeat protein
LAALGREPDFAPAYVARAHLLEALDGVDPEEDLRRAVDLDPGNRTLHTHLIQHYQARGAWQASLDALEEPRLLFPGSFDLDLLQAKGLLNLGRAGEAVQILEATHVLPSENARESHKLYEQAHLLAALDALEAGHAEEARSHLLAALEWPESLGQGRPYDPEERPARFLLGLTALALGEVATAEDEFRAVLEATGGPSVLGAGGERRPLNNPLDLLALPSLQALGMEEELDEVGWRGSGRVGSQIGPSLHAEYPHLFQGIDGQILIRTLQQYEEVQR